MSNEAKTRIPAPLYAAAGAGDLAYQQLRKLPAVVTELRGRATAGTADLRERAVATRADLAERAAATLKAANETAIDLRERAARNEFDAERMREIARRNANAMLAGAQAAQARAVEVYHQLVVRGEKVVGGGVVQAADTVNADIEATEAPAAVTATPADVAVVVEAAQPATPPATQPATSPATQPAAQPASKPARKPAAKATKTAAKPTRPAADK
jgi:hypothetical protein